MNTFAVDSSVRWSDEFIKNWILTEENAQCHRFDPECPWLEYEYDQEVLLAMFTLMGAPIWGRVIGYGIDCVLVYMTYDDCHYWDYVEPENLVLIEQA